MTETVCCGRWPGPGSLRFEDGFVCSQHVSEQQRRRVRAVDDAVRGRLGQHGWPYGANKDVTTRERLAGWIRHHDLHHASAGGCLQWLDTGRCGGCADGRRWIDHPSAWLNDTYRVFVTHPYPSALQDSVLAELKTLAVEHPEWLLDVRSRGWYGHGTWQITWWNER